MSRKDQPSTTQGIKFPIRAGPPRLPCVWELRKSQAWNCPFNLPAIKIVIKSPFCAYSWHVNSAIGPDVGQKRSIKNVAVLLMNFQLQELQGYKTPQLCG